MTKEAKKKGKKSGTARKTGRRGPSELRPLSRLKKTLFSLCTLVVITTLVELVLGVLGVQSIAVSEDPYVGFQSISPLFVQARDPSVGMVYRTAKSKIGIFNEQSFPVAKDRRAYRVFCLGGSTTHGRPYRDTSSFCGWLRVFLNAADPDRDWQVINAGGVSYASYRVARLMEELTQYGPDLFIVYSGHNEFLERRTYAGIIEAHPAVTGIRSIMYRSRIVSLMQSGLSLLRTDARRAAKERYLLTGEVAPLLETSAGLDLYHRDEPLRKQIVDHFRFNLGRMVAIARSVGAEIIFVQPASNLRDFSPFKSQHRDAMSERERTTWERLFDHGVQAAQRGDFISALESLREAERIDDRYALVHFELGRVLFEMGQHESARDAFERAFTEDVCPLRILPRMNDVLSEVAEQQNVDLIDFPLLLEDKSQREFGHRVLGNAYFFDHVHPKIAIHRILAQALMDRLVIRGIVTPTSDWNPEKADAVASILYGSLNPRDHALARAVLAKVLRWAGKIEESDRLIAEGDEQALLSDDAEYVALVGAGLHQRGKLEEAAEHYRRALKLNPNLREPRVNLGMILMDRGRIEESLTQFRQALHISPNYAVARYYLGRALGRQGRFDDAFEQFRKLFETEPDYPDAHASLGEVLLNKKLPGQAIDEINLELRRSPRSIRALNLLATAFLRLDRPEEAIEQYQRALQIAPHMPEIHHNLALALQNRGELSRAIEHYRRALQGRPDSTDIHINLAQALFDQASFGEAATVLDDVLKHRSTDPDAYYLVAATYLSRSRFASAIGVLRRGVDKFPADIRLITRLAWVLATCPDETVRSGSESLRLALQASQLSGFRDIGSLDALGAAYAESGRFGEAVDAVRRAVERAATAGNTRLSEDLRERLERYEQHRPFRLALPSSDP